jgi:protein ImuB
VHRERRRAVLDPPRRLGESDFTLLAGPERIESGWWDGGEVLRDYFIAQSRDTALLWIYRERRLQGGWFLHGIFA